MKKMILEGVGLMCTSRTLTRSFRSPESSSLTNSSMRCTRDGMDSVEDLACFSFFFFFSKAVF